MNFIKNIVQLIFSILFFISCASNNANLRRIDDIQRAEESLIRYGENEDIILSILNAAQNGNRDVRAESLWVLGELKAYIAYSDFIKFSVEDPDFNVRALAVHGIGKINARSSDAIDSIRRSINDTNLHVQIEALNVAGKLQEPKLLNFILGSLSSKNKWVRISAIEALKDYKDNRVDRSLNLLLSTDSDLAVKSSIKQILEYRNNNIIK